MRQKKVLIKIYSYLEKIPKATKEIVTKFVSFICHKSSVSAFLSVKLRRWHIGRPTWPVQLVTTCYRPHLQSVALLACYRNGITLPVVVPSVDHERPTILLYIIEHEIELMKCHRRTSILPPFASSLHLRFSLPFDILVLFLSYHF
jgi:hypothetical protein